MTAWRRPPMASGKMAPNKNWRRKWKSGTNLFSFGSIRETATCPMILRPLIQSFGVPDLRTIRHHGADSQKHRPLTLAVRKASYRTVTVKEPVHFFSSSLFDRQQVPLPPHSPPIAPRVPILPHHPMARDCNSHWIGRACAGHRTGRFRPSDPSGNFAVATRVAIRDSPELLPHQSLKGSCLNVQR